PRYRGLLAATGSRLVEGAEALAIDEQGLGWRRGGAAEHVACDTVVACLGTRLAEDAARLLREAGVLDDATLARLAVAPTVEQLARRRRARDADEALALAEAARPDLWRQVTGGVAG